MSQTPVILLGCVRQVGKDTLATLFGQINPHCRRFSFADPLRADLAPFVRQHFGIDIWHMTPDEKELVRPLLIAVGMAQRKRDPDYWVKRTLAEIARTLEECPEVLPVITDGRFVNEITLVKAAYPRARFVNVCRDGSPPPTEEEEKHYRQVAALADRHLVWGNDTAEEQREHARKVLEWMDL